jgi:hypothetical protein
MVDETSFADLKRRIARTIDFVRSFRPGDIDGSEERAITLTVGGREPRRPRRSRRASSSGLLPRFCASRAKVVL